MHQHITHHVSFYKASICSPRGGIRCVRLGDQNNRIDALCNLSDSEDRSYCATLQTRPTVDPFLYRSRVYVCVNANLSYYSLRMF